MPATSLQRAILENHHTFTALHRGTVIRGDGAVRWESDSDVFRSVCLDARAGLAALTADTRAVRTFPWSGGLAPELEARGFRQSAQLRYMVAGRAAGPPSSPPAGLWIEAVADEAGMERFSDVQSRGFADPGEDVAALRAFLHEANLRNLGHTDQRFYVAWLDRKPVAVTLLLHHDATAGIYAVATLPEHRRHGFSRALLSRVLGDAAGSAVVTLQVFRDSAAEQVYRRLGFAVAFDCQLWDRR